jgi:hypothetical protein
VHYLETNAAIVKASESGMLPLVRNDFRHFARTNL